MHDFTLLVLPGVYAASVALTQDMLQAAAALAPRCKLPPPRWRVVSPGGGAVQLSGGLGIATTRMPVRAPADPSTWVVPGLGVDSPADVAARLSGPAAHQAAVRLTRHVAAGGTVAASCSAVFLLQAAGLLRERRATTSWWLAPELRRLQPDCTVNADRMVVSDGPVTTAGAAFAQTDLMLHLIRARFSAALADAVGKVLLIDGRQAQSRFMVPAMLAGGNELIGRLTAFIESALPHPPQRRRTGGCLRHVAPHAGAPRARRHRPEPPGPGPGRAPEPGAPADREQPDAGGPGRAGGGVYRRYGVAAADAPGGGGESKCFS